LKSTDLLQRYRELAEAHASTDYGSPDSVARANVAADELHSIAKTFAERDPQSWGEFACLLEHPASASWAAHHLLEVICAPGELRERALRVVELAAERSDPNGVGERLWLREWRAKQ
jgi:hypothetical protein